ncbi:translation initiation factor eIF-2B [Nanoarchaeota archaeon]
MTFKKTLSDIKSLKIQGAENIAKEASKSIAAVFEENKTKRAIDLKEILTKARKKLEQARPTEPALRNSLEYIFSHLDFANKRSLENALTNNIAMVLIHFKEARKKIIELGARKIRKGMIVYTHCHSSTVTSILIEAKKQGKKFEVHNTETRPLFQGRITSEELAKHKIPVTHYVDSAARQALKKADLMLIGADAITSTGHVINKIGSELIAESAKRLGVPVFCCTNSWKFDPKTLHGYDEEIEKRSQSEIWSKAPKGVKIDNCAFEKVHPELITGIISELGIYKPEIFVEEVIRQYGFK